MAAQAWHPELDDEDRRRPRPRRMPRRSPVAVILWVLVFILLLVAGGVIVAWFSGSIPILARQNGPAAPATAAAGQPPAQQAQVPAQPANAGPQPTVVARETYGDWIYTCIKMPAGDETRCGIIQQLSQSGTGASVFLWRIAQDGKGGMIGEWETPTGIIVGRGITLDAGTEKPIVIPFQACTQGGCVAIANLAPDFVDTLSRAQAATAVVYPIGGQGVRLTLSVKGLAEGLAALGHKPDAAPAAAEPATAPAQ
jgi:invasion protein IalB